MNSDITIDISNELIVELELLANDKGMDIDDYIQYILEEEVLRNISASLVSD